ncbi:MAG: hypothetical protein K2M85_01340 [Paramuribaculum sp.]|nr:hypothetical protein [Paramuribaculum sp.]
MISVIEIKQALQKSLLLLLAVSSACSNRGDSYLISGEVEYVEEFPKELVISDDKPYLEDFMGVVAMKGADSLFLGIQEGADHFVGIYSFATGEKLADAFKKGQGPNEYSSWPGVVKTYEKDDSLYALLSASRVGLITINLTSTVNSGTEQITDIHKPSYKWSASFIPLENGDTIVQILNPYEKGGYSRKLISGCEMTDIPNLGDLEAIWTDVNNNTLGGIIFPIKGDSVIVEAMIELNQIMVYSLYDPQLRKTICVGDHLDTVEKETFFSRQNRTTNYDGIQQWNDYIFFLYSPTTEREFRANKGKSQLQVFDQDMKPVARIQLPVLIQSFYLNKDGVLYGFNPVAETETLYRWDISDLINQF